MDFLTLIVPSFIAGVLTFLAPCTFPLVPGYLSFIGGASATKSKIFRTGLLYVIGFSTVFIFLGSLFGLVGAVFSYYRPLVTRIGGLFVILFGMFLLAPAISSLTRNNVDLFKIPPFSIFSGEYQLPFAKKLTPGNPFSAFLFGATFAFGWTPCVGPILGTVLTLAASSATVGQGAFLLLVFSLGLAVPFLLIAAAFDWSFKALPRIRTHLPWFSFLGGVFLVLFGFLMVTDNFLAWIGFVYQLFDFINYDAILDYL